MPRKGDFHFVRLKLGRARIRMDLDEGEVHGELKHETQYFGAKAQMEVGRFQVRRIHIIITITI